MTDRSRLSRLRRLAGWAVLMLVAAGGCGGAGQAGGTGAAEAPHEGGDVTIGASLYAANCAECHGAQGQGTDQGPPLVHIIYEPGHHPDESFRRAVRDGVVAHHWDFGPMPPQPQVDDEELEAVIAHIRELQREAGIID